MDDAFPDNGRKDRVSQHPSTKGLIKDFCSYTTTHGFGRLAKANTSLSRFLWTGFIEVLLPAVTICNQNVIKNDRVSESLERKINLELEKRKKKERIETQQQADNEGVSVAHTAGKDAVDNSSLRKGNETDGMKKHKTGLTQEQSSLFDILLDELELMDVKDLRDMGHRFEDLVFECNAKNSDCRNYSKHWSTFWDNDYGNCFTFNGGVDDNNKNQTVIKTKIPGPAFGLKLILFMEAPKYIDEFTEFVGARIVVHDQGEVIYAADEGDDLQPGMSTSIGVQREIIKKVDRFNNGSCRKDTNQSSRYKQTECMRECLGDAEIKQCGCSSRQFVKDTRLVCRDTGNNTAGLEKCQNNFEANFERLQSICVAQCRSPCSETLFKTTISTANWPASGSRKRKLFDKLIHRHAEYEMERENLEDFIEDNFLQVRVHLKRINYREFTEELTYTRVKLLADIGGQLGLWIGMSVLTCCEVLELVLTLVQNMFKRGKENSVSHGDN